MLSKITSGHTYKLTSTQTPTVLNLMVDFKSIAGATWDQSENQKWVAIGPTDPGSTWALRNVATGYYLGIDGTPRATARVIATRDATEWDFRPDEEDPSVLRIVVPNAKLVVQLGEQAGGIGIAELSDKEGESQHWRFEEA